MKNGMNEVMASKWVKLVREQISFPVYAIDHKSDKNVISTSWFSAADRIEGIIYSYVAFTPYNERNHGVYEMMWYYWRMCKSKALNIFREEVGA